MHPCTTYYILFLFLGISLNSAAQLEVRKSHFNAQKTKTVHPSEIEPDFEPAIYHLEAPLPNGESYRSFLIEQKKSINEFNKTTTPSKNFIPKSETSPIIGRTFEPKRTLSNGQQVPVFGGIPSDNTLAIGNDGTVLLSMNSNVFAYDLEGDSTIFPFDQISLRQMAGGTMSHVYYDPKLFYDPSVDRYILALLRDFDPENSMVVICFSSSNDPNDPWYVYELPGNPLDNHRWTDFPAIAVTEDKFYFTANLIIPDVSWQVGFDGSLIWEMDKNAAFSGEESVATTLYDRIKFENKFIRNIHPIQGADGVADKMYFLSNRNFDITNDTLFLADFENPGELRVQAIKSPLPYGVPPNARQEDTDISDPTGGLQTNDARVLGAISFEDEIQFVANTNNPETGFSAIYHGVIQHLEEAPAITAHIIGDEKRDFAYPNIAWSGNQNCDRETIINFLHSSPEDFPGVSAVYYNNERHYSPTLTLKEGYNYVDRLPTHYERWGDYTGLQRKYNSPGYVASFGYLALENNRNSGYFSELFSPDSTRLLTKISLEQNQGVCASKIVANVISGTPPFYFSWNNEDYNSINVLENVCPGDTIHLTVSDANDCVEEKSYVVPTQLKGNEIQVFPNPSSHFSTVLFSAPKSGKVDARLYTTDGKLVHELGNLPVKSGKNEFVFSLAPLASGMYQLKLIQDNAIIGTYKVIKE